jgi:MFS family permease
MLDIGINTTGIGIATATMTAFVLFFNVPAGIVADKWSRKGLLFISSIALAISSVILATSSNLTMYIIGYLFLGVFSVSANGTYQALIYDTLREENREKDYSRIMGHIYGFYLIGLTGATALSGFIASHFSYRTAFLLSVIPCVLNAILISTIKEPTFHKVKNQKNITKRISSVFQIIIGSSWIRILIITLNALVVVEVFKSFGQLYIAHYFNTPQIIGILWAFYVFSQSLGSFFAHYFKNKLDILISFATVSIIFMAIIDSPLSIILFMIQTVAFAAFNNQIETRIQEEVPSNLRASAISILSSFGKALSIPTSLLLGWIIGLYDITMALKITATIAGIILFFWIISKASLKKSTINA